MAIAKNPKRLRSANDERKAEAFISGTDAVDSADQNKKPTMIRVNPELLARIDKAARRLGISRSAFIVSSTAKELERMES
jgi:Ribbon-helix-helix protein, copG family